MSFLGFVALCYLGLVSADDASCKPTMKLEYFSQAGQDKYCYEKFFSNKTFGTFAEIGAYDGTYLSNLKFFEQSLCWTGICVEPIKSRFDTLTKNRNCKAYNGAMCATTGKKEFWHVNAIGAASGFDTWSGFPDMMTDFHKGRINDLVKSGKATIDKKDMQCFSLPDLLAENNITHLDLVSLDVENYELPILQAWDFAKLNIDVLVVEDSDTDKILGLMKSNGYDKLDKLDADFIFRQKGAPKSVTSLVAGEEGTPTRFQVFRKHQPQNGAQ